MIETTLITTMSLHVRVPLALRDIFETEVGAIVAGAPIDLGMGWNCPPDRVAELLDDCEQGDTFVFLTELQACGRLENADDVFFFSDDSKPVEAAEASGEAIISRLNIRLWIP